ncbi:hypothetical protein C8R42DRAFT_714311 [Lentinula raphanica]|nr:hypothetical protein C8R42DRAFT_714311 [Lentinula raphanica]
MGDMEEYKDIVWQKFISSGKQQEHSRSGAQQRDHRCGQLPMMLLPHDYGGESQRLEFRQPDTHTIEVRVKASQASNRQRKQNIDVRHHSSRRTGTPTEIINVVSNVRNCGVFLLGFHIRFRAVSCRSMLESVDMYEIVESSIPKIIHDTFLCLSISISTFHGRWELSLRSKNDSVVRSQKQGKEEYWAPYGGGVPAPW